MLSPFKYDSAMKSIDFYTHKITNEVIKPEDHVLIRPPNPRMRSYVGKGKRQRFLTFDCNSSLALINCPMGDKGVIDSETFVKLLRETSTEDNPSSEEFWVKFAEEYNSNSRVAGSRETSDSCQAYNKSLYNITTNPAIISSLLDQALPEEHQQFQEKWRQHFSILASIYTNRPSLVPREGSPTQEIYIPETPPGRFLPVVQSSGSSLNLDLEMRLQTMLCGLLTDGLLNLKDVADAEAYLRSSTWASNILVHLKDLETVSGMIINARMDAREEKKKEKKKKRKMVLN